MSSATIKLFLPFGDPNRLRTAEISNWSGKAIAAPRTDLDQLIGRDESSKAGIYILTGINPENGKPIAYIGEAEIIRERLRQHRGKDFWVHAMVFISKDENFTKSHIRYLEDRLIAEVKSTGRCELANKQASGAILPESDREDMEIFLKKVRQLLPILGSDIVTPILQQQGGNPAKELLLCRIKGLFAKGQRTNNGFVVFAGSQAVKEDRKSAMVRGAFIVRLRKELLADEALLPEADHLRFTRDLEFSSPSTAAAIIRGGHTNGLTAWKTMDGKTLKQLELEISDEK